LRSANDSNFDPGEAIFVDSRELRRILMGVRAVSIVGAGFFAIPPAVAILASSGWKANFGLGISGGIQSRMVAEAGLVLHTGSSYTTKVGKSSSWSS
jgi:hypothetical protein